MTAHTGTITLVLLAYNHERFIAQCVESLAAQTYRSFDVVFIDDGSTDDTFDAGRRLLAAAGLDTHAVRHRDNGICRNLNFALREHATGEFVAILSADDWLVPTSFERRVDALRRAPLVAMVYAPVLHHYESTGQSVLLPRGFRSGDVFQPLLCDNFIPASTVLVRSSVLADVGPFDEQSRVEDWDMWLRIAERHPVGLIDEPLAFYRQHGNNLSRDERMMLQEEIYVLRKHLGFPAARTRLRRALVRYSMAHDTVGAAFRALVLNARPDSFTVRQAGKLVLTRALRWKT